MMTSLTRIVWMFLPILINQANVACVQVQNQQLIAKQASFGKGDKGNKAFPSPPDSQVSSVTKHLERLLSKHPYELSIRPKNKGKPIKVRVFLLIESITDISEKNMDLTFTLQMYETWTDERLAFNSSKKEESIVLPSRVVSKLWVPDLYIVGSKHSFVHRTMVENLVMRLFSNGEIYYTVKITSTVACQMDLKPFPLDTENCFLTLQSLGYNVDELVLEWVVGEHKNDLFMETGLVRNMPKFTLVHHNYHSYNSSASDLLKFTGMKSRLQISFELKRYLLAVFFQTYFPALSMVLLSGMGMWIDPKSVPARVAMGVTSVLTTSTIITGIKASLPKVSYLTALDVYLWTCYLFVFSTVLEFCILNYVMRKRQALKDEHARKLKSLSMELKKQTVHCTAFDESAIKHGCRCRHVEGLNFTSRSKPNNSDEKTATTDVKNTDFCCLPHSVCENTSCIPENPCLIDSYYRVTYLAGFVFFNMFYWVYYYYTTMHESEE